ncbi:MULTISPECIES: acyl carrier protein [Thalassotalea]|uniref:acyl carrier protein n=1 Tax=Thalassotalea TaxID=1518149 RepID=UPI0025742AB9|nr:MULTISPECIES: acyl carrier protein [Thalassotalea]MDO6426633.1 acyl carrier protein [Thalassotalea sp. 1_MG-2023]
MKSREEMLTTLSEILVEDFEVDEADIKPETHLYEELELDSIDAVDLVVKLSQITGKKINPDAFKRVRTVGDVIDELEALLLTK